MRCLSCQYDLRNLSTGGEHRCPECGREFDPNDPKTFFDPSRRKKRWWLPVLIIGALAYAGVLTFALLENFDERNANERLIRGWFGNVQFSTPVENLLESRWSVVRRSALQALIYWPLAALPPLLLFWALELIIGWSVYSLRRFGLIH